MSSFCTAGLFLFYLFKVMTVCIYLYWVNDLNFSGFIRKQLRTLTALPVCFISNSCTGRRFLFYLFKGMAVCIYLYWVIDFMCSGFIWKQLRTLTALPVCFMSVFCTCRSLCGMIQIFMLIRVFFTIFYSAFCANCLLSTSRSSSCMIATILAHSANSIFPLV